MGDGGARGLGEEARTRGRRKAEWCVRAYRSCVGRRFRRPGGSGPSSSVHRRIRGLGAWLGACISIRLPRGIHIYVGNDVMACGGLRENPYDLGPADITGHCATVNWSVLGAQAVMHPRTSCWVQNSVTVPYNMFKWLKKSTARAAALFVSLTANDTKDEMESARTMDCKPLVQILAFGQLHGQSQVSRPLHVHVRDHISDGINNTTRTISSCAYEGMLRKADRRTRVASAYFLNWYCFVPSGTSFRGLKVRVLPLLLYFNDIVCRGSEWRLTARRTTTLLWWMEEGASRA